MSFPSDFSDPQTRERVAQVGRVMAEHVTDALSFPDVPVVHFAVAAADVDMVIQMSDRFQSLKRLSAIPRTPVITHGDGWFSWHEQPGVDGNDLTGIHMVMPTSEPVEAIKELYSIFKKAIMNYTETGRFIITTSDWHTNLCPECGSLALSEYGCPNSTSNGRVDTCIDCCGEDH